ncbi:sulfatase [Thalassobaculum sp.]|uniref:sulfatase family protein n=1 Tax=Thalassobaculum sp. TaxID=2022740 RepID=UPI0032F03904
MRALRFGAGLVGLLAVCAAWASIPLRPAIADPAAPRPNVILILSDDEDVAIHRYMPKTKALIEDQGVSFDNYFVTYSLCCPSRATTLRGQYSHNHRIQGNILPSGGGHKFRTLGHDQSTIATWLHDAGYYTGLIGKYMNQYEPNEQTYVPPGWDEWYAAGHDYYNYVLNENGRHVSYGSKPDDYLTDVIARHTVSAIRRAAGTGKPFFFFVTPYAPHGPATAAPRHADLFADTPYPRPVSFDEADVSDKPAHIRDLPPLSAEQIAWIEDMYRRRLRSLQAMDDMVESIVNTLEAVGQLENTYIIYTSDNGWHMGEHRQQYGKTTAYEEDIRVPFVMRGPGVSKGGRVTQMVLNNDLAPSVAAMAGVMPPSFADGRSFLPLLQDPTQPWRRSFGIERRQTETDGLVGAATFHAVRTEEWTYVEYATGECELYDLTADPHQLANMAATADPAFLKELAQRAAELANCAGANCREIEDAPVGATLKVAVSK